MSEVQDNQNAIRRAYGNLVSLSDIRRHLPGLHEPAWSRDGKAGGPLRNATIAKIADRMVAFWDGKSRGTKSAIEAMQKLGKPVTVVKFMDPPTGVKWERSSPTRASRSGPSVCSSARTKSGS